MSVQNNCLNNCRESAKYQGLLPAQTSAEALKKIAGALHTTIDFLMYGDKDEKAMSSLNDAELLQQFKAVDSMGNEDKAVIKKLIDAFITKGKLKQLAL